MVFVDYWPNHCRLHTGCCMSVLALKLWALFNTRSFNESRDDPIRIPPADSPGYSWALQAGRMTADLPRFGHAPGKPATSLMTARKRDWPADVYKGLHQLSN